ncbi:MAG: N-formylglutamate amidohydrolase [Alphaproteobacteria bacterium]
MPEPKIEPTTLSEGCAAPAAVTVVNEAGTSPVVLICEHASNHIPGAYAGLGLAPEHLVRHIAWDIGAAALARRLSALLDAPLFLSGYSRLLIDCNRPAGVPSSIPLRSEDTDIPGNLDLSAEEVARRTALCFTPFQEAIARHLDARTAAGRETEIVGVHSFTPVFLGERRRWHAGVLHGNALNGGADALARRLLDGLGREPDLVVGDNEPYAVGPTSDYTVPVHGIARGLPAALIEVRNDLICDEAGVETWARRLAGVLAGMPAGHGATPGSGIGGMTEGAA